MKKAASSLVLLLLLTGCGLSGDDKTAAENIGTGIAAGDTPLSDEESNCFAEKLVDALGVDKLKEYKVVGDDLEYGDDLGTTAMDDGDAEAAADAFVDCVDIETQLAELTVEQGEQLDCITEKLDDATYRALMKATFKLDSAAVQEAMAPIQECRMTGLPTEVPTPTVTP
ncbi:MAG TPA: hypothetical protein VLI04_10085 [Nocardioidaceae bacterium]|nr:hypothetical protein [Nocardioidaceae bacterium]